MTNDEAIYVLKNTAWLGSTGLVGDVTEAVKMAVEALKRETSDDAISRQAVIDICNNAIDLWQGQLGEGALVAIKNAINNLPSVQPEPCSDAISREAVSAWLKQYGQDVLHGKYKFSLMYIWKNLMNLPSVQPTYTDAEVQKMQDMHQAEIEKAFELGKESAKAEIVRCKDCRWQKDQSGSTAWLPCRVLITPDDFYCGRAERRTDEH